jgi:ERCC4-type nuclease
MVMFNDNYIPPLSFERKSLADCIGSLSKGYKRFKKEILRAKENKIQLVIVIEGSITDVLNGIEKSWREGSEIIQQLSTIKVRYGIPFYCFNNRKEMERFILEEFLALGREYINSKKSKK